MRSHAVVLALVALSGREAVAQSPVAAGGVLIGGNARFSRLYDQGSRQHEIGFSIAPQVGVFVVDGLAVTLNGQLGWSRRDESATAFSWAAGPGVTYYLDVGEPRFFPYASLRTLWSRTRFEAEGSAPLWIDRVDRESSWTGALGGAWFVARHVAVTGDGFGAFGIAAHHRGRRSPSAANPRMPAPPAPHRARHGSAESSRATASPAVRSMIGAPQ